jgi:type IV secretion system protein VirD4
LRPPARTISLGAAPTPPTGENCDVREILAAATDGQDDEFDSMMKVLRAESTPKVRAAAEALRSLNQSFGDDAPRAPD